MKILVTGGLGFIGSHFARGALAQGHKVSIVDKNTYAADRANIADIENDLNSIHILDIVSADLTHVLANENFDVVINFAAESHVDRSISGAIDFATSNVSGVVNILESLKKGYFDRLIQVSTDEVYGSIESGSWNEYSPLDPRSPYSASKASAELFCAAYKSTFNLPITVTRCANNFGPNQSAEKLLPLAISRLLNGKKVPIYGNGSNVREWLFVSDHVNALLTILNSEINGVFNIGGTAQTNLEIVGLLLSALGLGEDSLEFVEDRLGHDLRYSVDDSLLTTTFGWKPEVTLHEGLDATLNWYRNNSDWMARSMLRNQE